MIYLKAALLVGVIAASLFATLPSRVGESRGWSSVYKPTHLASERCLRIRFLLVV